MLGKVIGQHSTTEQSPQPFQASTKMFGKQINVSWGCSSICRVFAHIMQKPSVESPAPHKPGMEVHNCNLSAQKLEAKRKKSRLSPTIT